MTMLPLLAAASSGVLAGCLTFVSFVDTRTINKLIDAGEEQLVSKLFQVWWPCGRDLMLPLVLVTSGLHGAAYAATGSSRWLFTGLGALSIGPYTAIVLGEDISALRKSDIKHVATIGRRFCRLHHPRSCIAGIVLAFSMRAIAHT
jgi:hypothetical protein